MHAAELRNGNGAPPDEDDPTMMIERGAIHRALVSPGEIPALASMLDPEHFHYDYHRLAWRELVRAQSDGAPLEAADLFQRLLPQVGRKLAMDAALVSLDSEVFYLGKRPVTIAKLVRGQAAKRLRGKLAERLREMDTTTAAERLEGIADLERDPTAEHPILSRVWSGDAFVTADLTPVPSLFGDGLLVKGGLMILAGHSGLGKTFVALQLMRSLAAGAEFLSFPCTPCRVGLLELEMPDTMIHGRWVKLGPADAHWRSNTRGLCIPDKVVEITDAEHRAWVTAYIRQHALDVLIVDPLNKLGAFDEGKGTEIARVMTAVRQIRGATGCAVILLHHFTKGEPEAELTGKKTAILKQLRGHGLLGNDPDTIVGLAEHVSGATVAAFAKTRYREEPDDLWLGRDEDGFFRVIQAPSDKADVNRERILKCLMLGPQTIASIAKTTRLNESTVGKHLRGMAPEVRHVEGTYPKEYAWEPAEDRIGSSSEGQFSSEVGGF